MRHSKKLYSALTLILAITLPAPAACGSGHREAVPNYPDPETYEITQSQTPEPEAHTPSMPEEQEQEDPEREEPETPGITPPPFPQNAKMISSGAAALMHDGSLWQWSGGHEWDAAAGEWAIPEEHLSPTFVMGNVAFVAWPLAIAEDGVLWKFRHNQPPVPMLENVVYAAASPERANSHAVYGTRFYAITADGGLWGWRLYGCWTPDIPGFLGSGTAEHPNLTHGDAITQEQFSPMHIMDNAASVKPTDSGAYVITRDHELWGWGSNWFGQLGGGTTDPIPTPVKIKEQVAFVHATGHRAPLAITTSGQLWSIGQEHELLMENVTYAHGSQDTAIFAIDNNRTLWAWGRQALICEYTARQAGVLLGDGTLEDRAQPVKILDDVVYFTTALYAAFAITTGGTLWAWGPNSTGELGDGTIWYDSGHPWVWGGWGDGLYDFENTGEPRLSPVRILDNVVSIAHSYASDHGWVGHINTFALTECGAVWAWGSGGGMLGDGTTQRRFYPVRIISGE